MNKKVKQVTIKTTSAASELVADVLFEEGSEGVSVYDGSDVASLINSDVIWDYVDEKAVSADPVVRVVGCFAEDKELDALKKRLEELRKNCPFDTGSLELTCALIRADNWDEEWKKYYSPIKTGRLVVVPEWINYAAKKGENVGQEILSLELLLKQLGITPTYRRCVQPALDLAERTGEPAAALELPDGRIVTGKTSALLGAASAMLLNALKALAGINAEIDLISPVVIGPIQDLKVNHLGSKNPRLHTDEVLLALSISAATNPTADRSCSAATRRPTSPRASSSSTSRRPCATSAN